MLAARRLSLFGGKLKNSGCLVNTVWTQNDRREVRMVHGIRKMLGLETKTAVLPAEQSANAGQSAVQEMTGVKLQPGFGGVHFQDTARLQFINARRQGEGFPAAVQNKIVIVANWLRFKLAESAPDCLRLREIERGIPCAGDLPGGNQCFINRSVAVRCQHQFVAKHVSGISEVEIRMVSEID